MPQKEEETKVLTYLPGQKKKYDLFIYLPNTLEEAGLQENTSEEVTLSAPKEFTAQKRRHLHFLRFK